MSAPTPPPVDPPMDRATLAHWHRLIAAAAAHSNCIGREDHHRGCLAVIPVESLLHVCQYAATGADVIAEAGLVDVVSAEDDADVRAIGRHLRAVRPGEQA